MAKLKGAEGLVAGAAVAVLVLLLPAFQIHDLVPRLLAMIVGAGTVAMWNDIQKQARKDEILNVARHGDWLLPRCGVPLAIGGFCTEPATPGCCYCDLHAGWPGKYNIRALDLP